MLIRPYSPADWERLCVIHDAARLHELEAAGLSEAFLSLEDTAENEGLFDGEVLVAESNGQVHGFVAFTQEELTWLYVDPGKFRQGVGRQLLRRAIAASAGNLYTEVLVGNEPALALYLREGFVVLRRSDGRLAGNEAYPASGYLLQRSASKADSGVGYD
jgi:ribosomal protein S18 acetylase RimI-like enzyme